MFDTLQSLRIEPTAPLENAFAASARSARGSYTGPERRAQAAHSGHWLALMLDEIDYGMVLVDEDAQVLHTNRAACSELYGEHPLQLLGGQLRARRTQDGTPLREALDGASKRQRRCLLTLGEGADRVAVAVVPLGESTGAPATLLVFGKRQMCQELSAQWFARGHGLTMAETMVLKFLCAGVRPTEVATQQKVAVSTVRSHISSIRAKTGAESIRALVRQVAVLPPLVNALRSVMH